MTADHRYLLAGVVVLTALVAVYAWSASRRKPRGSSFMPGDGASPLVRDAAARLLGDLRAVSDGASKVRETRGAIEREYGSVDTGGALNSGRLRLQRACGGMAAIASSIGRMEAAVEGMPPTHGNILALYGGLRDSDPAIRATAQALGATSETVLADAAATEGHQASWGQPHRARLRQLLARGGAELGALQGGLGALLRSTHRLGVALDLE